MLLIHVGPPELSVIRNRGVPFIHYYMAFWPGQQQMYVIERCPLFRGPL